MASDGKKEQLTGRVKEAAGTLLDDDELKNEGKVDQAAGETKEGIARVIDRVKETLTGKDE